MNRLVQPRNVVQVLVILALTAYASGAWNDEAEAVTTLQTSMPGNIDTLRGLLESRGWRVERTPDGSTLLIPVRATAEAQNQALPAQPDLTTADDCAEERQASSLTTGVKLPVDTRKEAWQIGVNWLWASEYRNLTVGKIRSINWIYLVTIVDVSPPYRTRNELIINKRTGQLLAAL